MQSHDPFGVLATGWATTVGAASSHLTHSFTVTTTDAVARLEFDVGTDTSTLCLDSVSLVRQGDAGVRPRLLKPGFANTWSRRVQIADPTSATLGKERDPVGRLGSNGSRVSLQPPDPKTP